MVERPTTSTGSQDVALLRQGFMGQVLLPDGGRLPPGTASLERNCRPPAGGHRTLRQPFGCRGRGALRHRAKP